MTISCKKRPFDYRNKYLGSFTFNYSIEDCDKASNPPCMNESGVYAGKIFYEKNDERDVIRINFAPNWSGRFRIDKNGNFKGCGITGKFEGKNSVSFVEIGSSVCTLALGSSYSYTVSGTKQ